MFPIARDYVHEAILVPDDATREAQQLLWTVLRIVLEPGAAAAVAALVCQRYQPRPGERLGILLCGGSTEAVDFNSCGNDRV
jgi:threonine dehydratase